MENPFWKKYFDSKPADNNDKKAEKGNNFKKFEYADDEDDFFDLDDLFGEFHGNTFDFGVMPPSMLSQFREVLRAMQEYDEEPDNNQRQKSFENKYNELRQKTDTDLDGNLYADQLDTLLKRISPEMIPKDAPTTINPPPIIKKKLLDDEKIMDIIHGTYREEVVPVKPRKRQSQKIPASAAPHHFGGLPPFDFPSNSGRGWAKTVISIRKQDGSFETRKMERNSDGQTTTTITKTNADGLSSTQTFSGDEKAITTAPANGNHEERNLITCDGYKIPCLW